MAVVKGVTVMGAGVHTGAAFDAQFIVVKNFRFETDAFRVVTPLAFQWTSFEKNRGPDAGAVMNREMLNIGDKAADGFCHYLFV
jgi:hypothetical protein